MMFIYEGKRRIASSNTGQETNLTKILRSFVFALDSIGWSAGEHFDLENGRKFQFRTGGRLAIFTSLARREQIAWPIHENPRGTRRHG